MSPDRAIEATQRGLRARRGFLVVHSGLISLVIVLAFVTACVMLQWLRTDLDWRLAPMSSYLKGPYGGWLRLAYYGLGAGLALLGQGLFHAVQPARNRLPMRLLALGGIALIVTAITETDLPYLVRSQELLLHQFAALITFTSVTLAMVLQSWHFRGHDDWRAHFRRAFVLAVASFIGLGIYAFERGLPASLELPEGFMQKIVITMIVVWLGFVAWCLHRLQVDGSRKSLSQQMR